MKSTPMLYQTSMVKAILRELDPKTITRRIAKMETVPGLNLGFSGLQVSRFGEAFCLVSRGIGAQWEERSKPFQSPYGLEGDQIWVRETFFAWGRWETRFSAKKGRDEWHFVDMTLDCGKDYLYAADGVSDTQAFIKRRGGVEPMYWKRPAIFMPRHASRITLEITGVRVERLQDISEADASAEGVDACDGLLDTDEICRFAASMRLSPEDCKPWYAALWESINGPGSWDANPWVWVVEFKRVTA